MDTETVYRRPAQAVRESYEASREMVQEHPLSSAATVFAMGFGLGLALGILLTGEETSRYESRMERFGRQALDALAQIAPDAISRRLS